MLSGNTVCFVLQVPLQWDAFFRAVIAIGNRNFDIQVTPVVADFIYGCFFCFTYVGRLDTSCSGMHNAGIILNSLFSRYHTLDHNEARYAPQACNAIHFMYKKNFYIALLD